MVLTIEYSDLNNLIYASNHFAELTPKRLDLIAEYVLSNRNISEDKVLTVSIDDGKVKETFFKPDAYFCRIVLNRINSDFKIYRADTNVLDCFHNQDVTSKHAGYRAILLLPTQKTCCGRALRVDNRPSHPVVYTRNGTYIAAMYHAECIICKRKYHLSYHYHREDVSRSFYSIDSPSGYFQISSDTVFEKRYLQSVGIDIENDGASFDSKAEGYYKLNNDSDLKRLQFYEDRTQIGSWKLSPQRLEEGWFLMRIVRRYEELGLSPNLNLKRMKNGRLNINELCNEILKKIAETPPKWLDHQCDIKGCRERVVVVDGNEKLWRYICSLPNHKMEKQIGMPNIIKCCQNDPVFGGKHNKPDKFCIEHSASTLNEFSDTNIDFVRITRSMMSNLPDNEEDQVELGCKKESNVDKFYNRTAGMFFAFRPCGIRVHYNEMFTSESSTQAFLFMLLLLKSEKDCSGMKYLVYDRACEIHPFINRLAKEGNEFAHLMINNIVFAVDTFHCDKHTKATCVLGNDNCIYNLRSTKLKDLHDVNLGVAEEGFHVLNKYKHVSRHLSRWKRLFFFNEMNDDFNQNLERRLRSLQLMKP